MPCCRGARLPPSDGLWAPLAGPRHLRPDPDPAASCRAEAAHPCDRPHPAHTQTSAPSAGAESRMHGRVWGPRPGRDASPALSTEQRRFIYSWWREARSASASFL